MVDQTNSTFIHLECTSCKKLFPKEQLLNLCISCNLPLFAKYDIEKARSIFQKDTLLNRENTMWRYKEMMPVEYEKNISH